MKYIDSEAWESLDYFTSLTEKEYEKYLESKRNPTSEEIKELGRALGID